VEAVEFATARDALAAFLAEHPALVAGGYAEMRLPDGLLAYVARNPRGDWVTVVVVSGADAAWHVRSWAASGC
jgi:hypothetical protein